MRKGINIISVDGMNGIGRSTQANVLSISLRQRGYTVLINKIKNNVESNMEATKTTEKFLSENPDGVVINDGSVATIIQVDIQNGMSYEDLHEKYRKVLFEYEKLQHKYGLANIIMITDNMELCNKRLIKRKQLMGDETPIGVEDLEREQGLLKGFKTFNNHIITRDIKFQVLNVYNCESIIEINERIVEMIANDFEIKKPSFEG